MSENPIPDFRSMPPEQYREARRRLAHAEIAQAVQRDEAAALARLAAQHEARFRAATLPTQDMAAELQKRGMTPEAAATLAVEIAAGKAKGGQR